VARARARARESTKMIAGSAWRISEKEGIKIHERAAGAASN